MNYLEGDIGLFESVRDMVLHVEVHARSAIAHAQVWVLAIDEAEQCWHPEALSQPSLPHCGSLHNMPQSSQLVV